MESASYMFERNQQKRPNQYLTPHPQKIRKECLNVKTRSKSDSTSPFEKENIFVQNKNFIGTDMKLKTPLLQVQRTPLQTLSVLPSSGTPWTMFDLNSQRKTQNSEKHIKTSFNIFCDDSNTKHSEAVMENISCLQAVTPVIPKTKLLKRSLFKNLNGAEEKEIKENVDNLKLNVKSAKAFNLTETHCPNYVVSKNDATLMNTSIEEEEHTNPFIWSASPETIGKCFWSEDDFFKIVEDDLRLSIQDMIKASEVETQRKKTNSPFLISVTPSTPVNKPICNIGFSEDTNAAFFAYSSKRKLQIPSPVEIPVLW